MERLVWVFRDVWICKGGARGWGKERGKGGYPSYLFGLEYLSPW